MQAPILLITVKRSFRPRISNNFSSLVTDHFSIDEDFITCCLLSLMTKHVCWYSRPVFPLYHYDCP